MRKIVITGGSGYIGGVMARYFLQKGDEVHVISRHKTSQIPSESHFHPWDAKSLGAWTEAFENATAIINMAGKSVNCRYNEANKAEIYASRLDSTRVIGEAIEKSSKPPLVWLNASTGTIYRHAEDRPMDEISGEMGTGFSVDVAQRWEKAFFDAPTRIRKIALRMSIVFGDSGGAFPYYANLAKYGLGGKMGNGKQKISWIDDQDLCKAIDFLIENSHLEGVFNLASPEAISNKDFMQLLRKAYKMPIGLPSTRWMLSMGAWLLDTETELILKSRWVYPKRLLDAGFQFATTTPTQIVQSIISKP
jgi:uncharacterized protein (TIGR01777 family)